ncbi:MAG: AAA family ATPase [Isosphaeraceae bacterium]
MKEAIQIVLVDPISESRQSLQRLLGGLPNVWLSEVCTVYAGAAKRVSEVMPALVVVVVDEDPAQAINLISTIIQNCPNVAVLPASMVRDSSMILRVVRAGAREFLPLPAHPDELQETINRLVVRRDEAQSTTANNPQVIAVTGAAGGIGCTTLAVNIATTMSKGCDQETVLVDFDLMLGSVDACLDIIPDHTLQGVIQNIDRLDLTLLKRSMTRHSSGLYVLPHPVAMEESAKLDPESLRRVLVLLKAAFPTVVLDTSKGLQSSDFVAFEMADIIVIVVQLDLTCLRNTARLLQLFQQFEGFPEKVRLVANRIGSHESEISLKKAEETLRMPVSWQVPNATKVLHAARAKGVPIDAVGAGSRVHQSILEVARGLKPVPATDGSKPRRGLFAAFF